MKTNELFLIMAIENILNWHDEKYTVMWDQFCDEHGRCIISTPNEACLEMDLEAYFKTLCKPEAIA